MCAEKKDLFGVCPFATTQRLLSGKWVVLILFYLSKHPYRFNELQRQLPSMTQATLAKQLKALESEGLIIRTVYPQVPPKVVYSLSEMGEGFRPVLDQIRVFGNAYLDHMGDHPEILEAIRAN